MLMRRGSRDRAGGLGAQNGKKIADQLGAKLIDDAKAIETAISCN
jgi:hypothetical protein